MSFLIRYCDIPDKLASNFLIYWSDIHKTIYPTLCPTDVRRIVLRQFNCERYIRYEGIEEVLYYRFNNIADYTMFVLRFA